jgi:hypothetical protein
MKSLDDEAVLGGGYAPYHDAAREHVPTYGTAAAVGDALAAVKTRFDHGDAPYDPDVLGLIRAAEAMRAKLYGPDGGDPMPVFVIQGKDQLAQEAIAAYGDLCVAADLPDQASEVEAALAEVNDWQRRHPDLVKLPDHEHVPVTGRPA